MAAVMSLGIFGGNIPEEPARPDANTVTAYSTADADYTLGIDAGNEIHDISDLLFGIFFEDINFAADGGLYAEMVLNRSFEFTEIASNDALHGWNTVGGAEVEVCNENGLNKNNTNYIVIKNNSDTPSGVANVGFLDGMSIENGKNYRFSVYAKGLDGYNGKLYAKLMSGSECVGEGVIDAISSEWSKYNLTLNCTKTDFENATLQVLADNGKVALDMISLFPEDTFKGRENGMRKDLG